jgi:hypothetical protein
MTHPHRATRPAQVYYVYGFMLLVFCILLIVTVSAPPPLHAARHV